MSKLTDLVIAYRKEPNDSTMNQVVSLLFPIVKKKAQFIFYRKYFFVGFYDKEMKEKKYFNLYKSRHVEYCDVEQDLWVTVLEIIKNYDIKKDFQTYLFATLWNWTPSFINRNFIRSLSNCSLEDYLLNQKDDSITDDDLIDLDIRERKIVKMLQEKETQKDISTEMGCSESLISKTLKKIGKKLRRNQ